MGYFSKVRAWIFDSVGNGITSTSNALDVNIKSGGISGFALETGGNLASVKTNTDKIPSQGQALAASCMPVVLPTAQITTLTPPAAIIGYALETGGNLATVATNTSPSSGGGHISNLALDVTATQIDGASHACKGTIVSALPTNTDAIHIGFSTLTGTNGIPLYPGDSISFPVTNTNLIYALAVVLNEDVSVTYFN